MIDRHGADSASAEHRQLWEFLNVQRECVLAIVEGLDEAAFRKTVVPSGWTPLGMIEHLGHAERFWFQHVVTGDVGDLPWRRPRRTRRTGVLPAITRLTPCWRSTATSAHGLTLCFRPSRSTPSHAARSATTWQTCHVTSAPSCCT